MRRSVLLLIGVTIVLAGCGRFQGPPVELGYRDSLVGAGKIIRIENSSNEALTGLAVEITSPSGESRTFALDQLAGYGTVEIGWKKLGGWHVPADSKIKVHADGFLLAFNGELLTEKATE